VSFRAYDSTEKDWRRLGQTPLEAVRLPRGLLRFSISKAGYGPVQCAFATTEPPAEVKLDLANEIPAGMVRVIGNRYRGKVSPVDFTGIDELDIPDYFIDRCEVTNREYRSFVEAGGYLKQEYWQEPFTRDGASLSWEAAMKELVDQTGQSGPATW